MSAARLRPGPICMQVAAELHDLIKEDLRRKHPRMKASQL